MVRADVFNGFFGGNPRIRETSTYNVSIYVLNFSGTILKNRKRKRPFVEAVAF